jgi:hypothetical protein
MPNPLFHPKTIPLKAGAESHATRPARQQQQQDHGWQSPILKPQQTTGQPPAVQPPTRQSSRKSALANVPRDVCLDRKWINRVFTEPNIPTEEVKQNLVNHDGHNPAIEVKPGTVRAPGSNRISWEKVGVRTTLKWDRTRPTHAFGVLSENANEVAMALAKAGMRDFEVATDEDIQVSYFIFPTQPEKEVATIHIIERFDPQVLLLW